MQQNICSEGLYRFLNALQAECATEEELISGLSTAMEGIAQELGIGYMALEVWSPSSILEPKGRSGNMVIYECPDNYDVDGYVRTKCFKTGNNGTATFTVMPRRGLKWNDSEERIILLLEQSIMAYAGRLRIGNLLERSLRCDNLTGALNTRGLMQYGGRLCAQRRIHEFTVVFMNLKNFKYINTRVGDRVGDRIMTEYVRKTQEFLNAEEIIARPGGDNFVILVKNERIEEYLKFAAVVPLTLALESGEYMDFEMRAKMGVYPANEWDTMNEVMNAASVALNVARRHRRNQDVVWYMPQMLEQTMHSRAILNAFPKALSKNEFSVCYQPKVDVKTQRLYGAEALVRWVRVDRIVRPQEFVSVLEQEGMICQLDFYVFEEICRTLRDWLDNGIEPVRISSNFSKLHLSNERLLEQILAIMEKYRIDSKYIEIELTEMSGEEDFAKMAEFIACLHEKGISVSIDDFGTGYSTLNMLKELNVDVIKLDKSFLDHLERGERADHIVIKNIINMVQELEIAVLAEGVENKEQLEFLKNMKCEVAQGYFFDRPLLKEEFEIRLKDKDIYVKR